MVATTSPSRKIQLNRRLTLFGLLSVTVGAGFIAVNAPNLTSSGAASAITLSLTTTSPGATCNNGSNPVGPICSGLAGGDVINVAGAGFTPGATASIVECSSAAS